VESIIFLFLAGAAGALVKEVLEDNKLVLPKKIDGELALGFLGSLLVGGFVGYAIDGSYLTAAMAGFAGFSAIEKLVIKKDGTKKSETQSVEDIIRYIAKQECVDPDLCIKVAKCESGLDPRAININASGSRDRGLFQINDKYHPEMTDEMCFSPEQSTKFFCKAFKNGNLSWWNASKKCWG